MKSLPQWAERFLRIICPEDNFDQTVGDLIELYNHDVKTIGEPRARRKLMLTILRFARPGIILRNRLSVNMNLTFLFQHYLKTSLRHFLRSKLNFSFKVGGLVMALSSFLVIVLYVSHQLSFDRFHDDYQNIYRVNSQWRENGELMKYALVPTGVGAMLKSEFPEVRSYTMLGSAGQYQVRYKDRSFQVEGIADADSTVFDVFTFKFLQGDKRSLVRPNSIVLSQSLATRIFGDEDPMHKSISFVDRSDAVLEVTGIIEDFPPNTHLYVKALASFKLPADEDSGLGPWDIHSIIDGMASLYVRLENKSVADKFVAKASPEVRTRITRNEGGLEKEYSIHLQPLKDIHLDTPIYAEFNNKGNAAYVYAFSILGVFLLIISGINYVNLSIADFHKRSKEIGVRKVMGARKKQIAFQVVVEAALVSMLSLLISIFIVYFTFPQVQQTLEPNLRFRMLLEPGTVAIVGCIVALLIILSTAYPAYTMAVNNPVNDLKSGNKPGKNPAISSVLLLGQFTISVICICATFIVASQLEFMQAKNPGYDRHNLLVVYLPGRYPPERNAILKDELAGLTGVDGVSFSTFRITGAGYFRDWYRVEIDGEMKRMLLNEVFFDHDFFRVTGIPLVAGRSFDPAMSTDAHEAFIVNETAVREFGWKDPIGKRINYGYDEADGEKWEGTIVGVVRDFNVHSLHKKIDPIVMRLPWSDWPGNCIHVRVNGPLSETIARIKQKYEEILPGFLLSYNVIDDLYNDQYQNERKTYTALQLSTWIIVMISALGIFSLSLFVSVSRMKEYGIRKVLGATARQIILLHAGRFIKIALWANVIALPVAYILAHKWLDEFAYKTEVNSISFLLVSMLSLFLVLVSAGYAAWKSGHINPVQVIKMD